MKNCLLRLDLFFSGANTMSVCLVFILIAYIKKKNVEELPYLHTSHLGLLTDLLVDLLQLNL